MLLLLLPGTLYKLYLLNFIKFQRRSDICWFPPPSTPPRLKGGTGLPSRYKVINIKGMLHVPFFLTHMPHAPKWDQTALKQILISNSIPANSFRPDKQQEQPPPHRPRVSLLHLLCICTATFCYNMCVMFVFYCSTNELLQCRCVHAKPSLSSVWKRFTV